MDYKYHMMTKKCIRIHTMTHFRKDILKEMLMNQTHNTSCNGYKHWSYSCYICGVRDTTSSYIINHLGIYHKRLDFYNNFILETDSFENSTSRLPLIAPKPTVHELTKKSSITVESSVNYGHATEATVEKAIQVLKWPLYNNSVKNIP